MKTVVMFVLMLFSVIETFAQTSYYSENKEFIESDYVYVCELDSTGFFVLRNKEYKLTIDDLYFKDTGRRYVAIDERHLDLLDHEGWLEYRRTFYDIIRYAFSEEEMKLLRGGDNDLYVMMFINTETGKIDEVSFSFFMEDGLKYIPVTVFRHIELQIKDKCRLVIAEDGKLINYIFMWDCFEF